MTQRDLVRNALRMRPDRIIIGEVRGAEAFDMLQAMNTGHEGSLTTVHANSPRDALIRLENMVHDGRLRPAGARDSRANRLRAAHHHSARPLRRWQAPRSPTSPRSPAREGDTITTQDLFVFRQSAIDAEGHVMGELEPTGIVPTFTDEFTRAGVKLDMGFGAPVGLRR